MEFYIKVLVDHLRLLERSSAEVVNSSIKVMDDKLGPLELGKSAVVMESSIEVLEDLLGLLA